MLPKTIIGWAFLIIVIVLIWKHPGSAGHAVNSFFNRVGLFFDSL